MARYPEVNFDIAVSDRFVNLIEEGFNLAIRVGPLGDSNLIARQLASPEFIVCASPAYLERAGRPQTPADLRSHSCLIFAETIAHDTWQFRAPDGRTETVRVAGRFTCTHGGFVHEMALAGHGIVFGPSFSFSADIATGGWLPCWSLGACRASYQSTLFIRIDPCSRRRCERLWIFSSSGSGPIRN
jgi:DNA-binding transcriptional LysR family regulator